MFSGGLDEALYSIIHECQQQGVPFIFALSRKALGKACAKQVPVSIVGIFNYEGAEVRHDAFYCNFVLCDLDSVNAIGTQLQTP